jgi:hypothetical protein
MWSIKHICFIIFFVNCVFKFCSFNRYWKEAREFLCGRCSPIWIVNNIARSKLFVRNSILLCGNVNIDGS